MAKKTPNSIPTKPEGHAIPAVGMSPELELTLEQRFERIERDLLEAKLVSYCACNYSKVLIEYYGLAERCKKNDIQFEKLKNGDF